MVELLLDPLYRGPFLGTILMSFSMALVGALMFVRKQSLIAETISHATFPGVAIGALVAAALDPFSDELLFWAIFFGAFIFGVLGYLCVEKIRQSSKKADVSLCYTLATFFAVGVLIASYMQNAHTLFYKKIQIFFYGQAATMTDTHIALYGCLSLLIVGVVFSLFRAITYVSFDPLFAKSLGLKVHALTLIILLLLVLAIVIGIRSVGIVLISGMLIAPSVAARAWTQRFSRFVMLASCIAVVAAAIGNSLSLMDLRRFTERYLPPGPMTVVIASCFAFVSLLISPKKGWILQIIRKCYFRSRRLQENLLKMLWKVGEQGISFAGVKDKHFASQMAVWICLKKLSFEGFVVYAQNKYFLTQEGRKKASYIVRLHRLWELYLIEFLSTEIQSVHQSAEEIEHFITPDLEVKLTKALSNPEQDPHQQPIPPKEYL